MQKVDAKTLRTLRYTPNDLFQLSSSDGKPTTRIRSVSECSECFCVNFLQNVKSKPSRAGNYTRSSEEL